MKLRSAGDLHVRPSMTLTDYLNEIEYAVNRGARFGKGRHRSVLGFP